MKVIDIDKIEEIETQVHYIKSYNGSVILMDRHSKIFRFNVNFSFEHRPIGDPIIKVNFLIGDPIIKVNFLEHPHIPVIGLISKVKDKLLEKSRNGIIVTGFSTYKKK